MREKVDDIQKQINVPMLVMIITEKGHNRKPDVGSWEILEEHFNNKIPILKNKSFYCGDAAGRNPPEVIAKDFSNSDREYAENIGLTFFTPESMFRKETEIDVSTPTSTIKRNKPGESQGNDVVSKNNVGDKENLLGTALVTSQGTRCDTKSNIKKIMFEELQKLSSEEDVHAYITGIAEHDPSRLFDKRDAINAADWANKLCKHGKYCKEKDFPKLFQLSYEWIYDTGASRHFTGRKRAEKFKDHLETIRQHQALLKWIRKSV